MGDIYSKPWQMIEIFAAARQFSRQPDVPTTEAATYVKDFEENLIEHFEESEAEGTDRLRYQVLRFQAAWNTKDWPLLADFYFVSIKASILPHLKKRREAEGELESWEIIDLKVGRAIAEAQIRFTYTKAGERVENLTFTREEDRWKISSDPRKGGNSPK